MVNCEERRGLPKLKKELRIHLEHYGIGCDMNDDDVKRRARIEIRSIEREIDNLRRER